jgi:hypothetical protein
MGKTQISTSVSPETRRKADALTAQAGYTLREVISLGVDRLYAEWEERRPTMYTDNELYDLFVAPETGPQEILSLSEERIADQVHDLILDAEAWDDDPRHNSEDPRLPRTDEGEVDYLAIARAIRRAARH